MVTKANIRRIAGEDNFVTCTLVNEGCRTTVHVESDVWDNYLQETSEKN